MLLGQPKKLLDSTCGFNIKNTIRAMLEYKGKLCKLDSSTGYLYINDTKSPLRSSDAGKVYLHRLLISDILGRNLNTEEHVHHIDGDKLNNSLSNLSICSSAEHAKLHKPGNLLEVVCPGCGVLFTQVRSNQINCSEECYSKSRVRNPAITKDMLEAEMPKHTWTSLGKLFGYSDNGIKKRAKALGCDLSLIRTARNK